MITSVRLLQVRLENALVRETLPTDGTLERFLLGVNPHVHLHGPRGLERFSAHLARVVPRIRVDRHVFEEGFPEMLKEVWINFK